MDRVVVNNEEVTPAYCYTKAVEALLTETVYGIQQAQAWRELGDSIYYALDPN